MPNKLKRLPKLYRNRRGGRETGSYHVEIRGVRFNLRTKNPTLAHARRAEAYKTGRREFPQDDSGAGGAAQAIASSFEGTGGASTPPVVEPPRPAAPKSSPAPASEPTADGVPSAHTVAAALPPSPAAAPHASSSSVHPDAYIPPPNGWAAAVSDAAAAGEGTASSEADDDEDAAHVDSDMLKEMIEFAAGIVVDTQLWLQQWAIRRGLRVKAAMVSDDAKGREVGRKMWVRCFQRLMPSDLPIPDYLAAPLMVAALTLPIQLGPGATAVDDTEEQGETAPSSPAAAAAD